MSACAPWVACFVNMFTRISAGLDKLWTPEDYLTIWYADPDLNAHEVFDRSGHRELMEARRNQRLFSRNILGGVRPNSDIPAPAGNAAPPPLRNQGDDAGPRFYREDEDVQV